VSPSFEKANAIRHDFANRAYRSSTALDDSNNEGSPGSSDYFDWEERPLSRDKMSGWDSSHDEFAVIRALGIF